MYNSERTASSYDFFNSSLGPIEPKPHTARGKNLLRTGCHALASLRNVEHSDAEVQLSVVPQSRRGAKQAAP